jgi:hypothetical protein
MRPQRATPSFGPIDDGCHHRPPETVTDQNLDRSLFSFDTIKQCERGLSALEKACIVDPFFRLNRHDK